MPVRRLLPPRTPVRRLRILLALVLCLGLPTGLIAALLPSASAATTSVGMYTGTETFAGPGAADSQAVELGTRFTVGSPGSIVSIRFYKTSANVGAHTGSVWDRTGERLATVTFSAETSSGWQVAKLSNPVAVVDHHTYVVSYHTKSGHYAATGSVFASGRTIGNASIRGSAGVYRYGSGGFPSSTYNYSAYWVDALFTPNARTPAPTSPAPTSTSPSPSPTTTAPASCQQASYLWANLATCGRADAYNTGPQLPSCPSGLAAMGGGSATTTHVTVASTTISCKNISGCLSIEAPNVTVKNVQIACTSGRTGEAANGTAVIFVDDGASATVDHVRINGMKGVHACIWHQGTSMTARAVDCSGVNDGIFSWADTGFSATTGDHFTIQDSYFHDFTKNTANGHIDGYQTEGAGDGLIQHNTYLMTSDDGNSSDSAIAIWNGIRSSHDITVRDNLIAGGGFAIYAEDYNPSEASPAGGASVTKIAFANNVFSTKLYGCVGNYGVWYTRGAPTDGWNRSGNKVLETGQNIDAVNPTYQGRTCT